MSLGLAFYGGWWVFWVWGFRKGVSSIGVGFLEEGLKRFGSLLWGGVVELVVGFLVEVGNLWSSMSGGVRNLELGMGWSIWGRFCGEALVALISVLW